MEKQFFVAITGMNGAGKSEILGKVLKEHGFTLYSISEVIIDHAKASWRTLGSRDEIRKYANEVREVKGGDFFLKLCIEKATQAARYVPMAVFESIRTLDEVDFLRKEKITLLSIDAPFRERFERIQKRGSLKDDVKPLQFRFQELKEVHHGESWKQNLPAVMSKADRNFYNDSTPDVMVREIQRYLWSIPELSSRMTLLPKVG